MSLVIVHSPAELRDWRAESREPVGLVPTMGALHEGHATLIRRAAADGGRVLVSIFVNPTQFDDPNDLARYPKTWEADLALAKACGADAVWAPKAADLYPDGFHYQVSETELSRRFCGAHRQGHFRGVLTVVLKLLLAARADRAYFGEKDWQQLQLVRGMVEAFFVPTAIVAVPTMREADGLAMSSRNVRLGAADRAKAVELHAALTECATAAAARARLEAAGWQVDYVEDWEGRRLAAARLGGVRLIDNVPV